MTDRTITAAAKTETEAASLIAVLFAELDFDGPEGALNVWTGTRDLTFTVPGETSKTWTAVGDLGAVSAVGESADRRINGVNLTLSQVNSDLLNEALLEDYQGRNARIWLAFLDSSHVVIADPVQIFGGIMDTMTARDGDPSGALDLACEPLDALLRRRSLSMLTDEEQRRLHTGDTFLAFVQELSSKEIIWGQPSPAPARSGGGLVGGVSGPGDPITDTELR